MKVCWITVCCSQCGSQGDSLGDSNVTLKPTLSELWSWQPTVTIGKCDTQYDLMWLTM